LQPRNNKNSSKNTTTRPSEVPRGQAPRHSASTSVETVRELSHPEYLVTGIRQEIHDTQLRPLSELVETGLISDAEHDGYEIKYTTEESSDTIAMSIYAVTERVAYLSWIWVSKPLRGNGIDTRLTEQTIRRIQNQNVRAIYALPKSKAAKSIFDKLNFDQSAEINESWRVRRLT